MEEIGVGWEREQQPKKSWFCSALVSRQAVMAFSRNTGGICTKRRFLGVGWAVAPSFSKELFPGVWPQAQLTVKDTALGALGVGFYLCLWHKPLIAAPEIVLFLPSRSFQRAGTQPRFLHGTCTQHSKREIVLILTQTVRNSAGAINMPVLHLLF